MNIAITGYYGTGSSAVLDLLAEYEGTSEGGLRSYEHVPFYYPGGLFDLEMKLLYGNDPHRSDEAIKTFRNAMDTLNRIDFGWFGSYEKRYGSRFQKLVEEFLEEIVQFSCPGEWYHYYSEARFSPKKIVKDSLKSLLPGKQILGEFGKIPARLTRGMMEFSFIGEEAFYAAAKKFISGYFAMINEDKSPVLLLDHLLFPHNAYKIDRFFDDDFRLIVVERDLRDMFCLCKHVWPTRGFRPPYPTEAEAFLKHWSQMVKAERRKESEQVLYVQFEDLIYRYEETKSRIETFAKLDPQDHKRPKTRFVPENSIHNTQNFRIEKEWEEEATFFEGKTDLIYDFPFERKTTLSQTFDEQE